MKQISPSFFVLKLTKYYKNEICHLVWDKSRPWTLLFAVILSAQCTDKQVNIVTQNLFIDFPDMESYIARPLKELEQVIHSTGFFRMKAKSLAGCAKQLSLKYSGLLPNTMKELTSLPGVGRKTANVILWNVFEKNEGFVVDTHIARIAYRTGMTKEKNPEKIEQDLMRQLPRKEWGRLSHRLVQFGRDFCTARKPKCEKCFFQKVCPKSGIKNI